MSIKDIITKADADADLTGTVSFTEDEWRKLRMALVASHYRSIADQLRALVKHFGIISYARHHREAIDAAKQTLKDAGEPIE